MIVRPDEISASSAPSTSPLKHCDTKLAQLITLSPAMDADCPAASWPGCPGHPHAQGVDSRHIARYDVAVKVPSPPRRGGEGDGVRYSRRACSRRHPASASAARRAALRGLPSSLPCSSCPWAPCP